MTFQLRVLATSDVHGALTAKSELTGQPRPNGGLTRVATAITAKRAEVKNALLLDNGDFLQGEPNCDLAVTEAKISQRGHPVIQAMNHLSYDAATVGNHEFDYGVSALKAALAQSEFPVVSSNLRSEELQLPRTLLLQRQLMNSGGHSEAISIGIFGLLPPQVMGWNQHALNGTMSVDGYLAAAKSAIASLKSQGADLIIALCHGGLAELTETGLDTSGATEISQLDGIDAMIAGHTHDVFPPPVHATEKTAAKTDGFVNGIPTVMPGYHGAHLGLIDLSLKHENGLWYVSAAQSSTHSIDQNTPESADLNAQLSPTLNLIEEMLSARLGNTECDLKSYFAQVTPDLPTRVCATTIYRAASDHLAKTNYTNLPLLVAAAPFKCGGRGGPSYFTSVAAGPISRRQAYDLQPFNNAMDAFIVNGAQLRDWLEKASECLAVVPENGPPAALWRAGKAIYDFDTVFGVTYEIDLNRPRDRIRNLKYKDTPVRDKDRFVLVTTSYRGGGGGNYPHRNAENRIYMPKDIIRDMLVQDIKETVREETLLAPPWSLVAAPGTRARFETNTDAARQIPTLPNARIEALDRTELGFLDCEIIFGNAT